MTAKNMQRQKQQQIPCEDDRKKSNGKRNSNRKRRSPSGMTKEGGGQAKRMEANGDEHQVGVIPDHFVMLSSC
jgi:hypothetical protein